MRLATLFLLLAFAPGAFAQSPTVLWYDKPATDWEREALPIGNGRIGALASGGVDSERVRIAEKSLWSGGPGSEGGYGFGLPAQSQAELVRALGKQLLDGARLPPEDVAKQLGRGRHNYGEYQSFGELIIERETDGAPVADYRRELDLDTATARISFKQGGAGYRREYFVSYPDQVLVARWYATGVQKLRVKFAVPDNRSAQVRVDGTRIIVSGALRSNGLRYAVELRVIVKCGAVTADGDSLRIETDCEAMFVLAARTNYQMRYPEYRAAGADPAAGVAKDTAAANKDHYAAFAQRHLQDHQALFRRVKLTLDPGAPKLPTDRLRAQYGSGNAVADRQLEQLYFQYGRYLLIAASRAGSLPASNADYRVNIHLQMSYWPAEVANLAETTPPLFDFVDHLVAPGTLAAQRFFGASGWTLFSSTNAWGYVGPGESPAAFWQPEAAAWLAQHFYEHYLFSQDAEFLKKRAWPVMKGATEFWLDALVADPRDGKLTVSPSYLPDHGPFTAGAAMSQQIVAELFVNTSAAAHLVGDKAFATRIDEALSKLDRGLHISKWGQLQEWKGDLDDPKNDHPRVSHLFALYPGRAIDPARNPELVTAARLTLDARGDAGAGSSRAWKINFWARLRDGERAHKLLEGVLRDSASPNLGNMHPPVPIDNSGAAAGMIEMLLQSHHGELHILPAVPKAWVKGSISGIRARGDVTVDIDWDSCGASKLVLTTGHAGLVSVRSTLFEKGFDASVKTEGVLGSRKFMAKRNGEYTLTRAATAACGK